MPARISTSQAVCALVVAGCAWALPARAQTQVSAGAPSEATATDNSNLDASLFYQLLVGELELTASEGSTAFLVMLDAANKTKNEQLYRRAADMALQIRAGTQALIVVQSWRTALPASLEAHRYLIQLLVALNRSTETAEPLRSLIKLAPAADRPALIASLPRFFERTADRKVVPDVMEAALQPSIDQPETRTVSLIAIGRAWQSAGDNARALEFAQRAHVEAPMDEGPVFLALELLPVAVEAEPIILGHLQARPQADAIRMFYARALSMSQRHADALVQVEQVTRDQPALSAPWLTLGALYLDLRRPKEATVALKTFIERIQSTPETPVAPVQAPDNTEVAPEADRGVTQAWLMLAQAAEQEGDFKAAEIWLNKVETPQRALEVQVRRASLLAKQGRLSEGLALIERAPETGEAEARAKVFAEVQLLREGKQWAQANQVLAKANERFADDPDLLYEQSMMEEKLNHMDEMERLLRRVIALRPDHHHAHNALGFSLADRGMRLPEAKSLIEHALELAPGEPFIIDSLGWVDYRMGNRTEAIKQLTRAYQSRPDPEIAAHLGEVLWVNGQRDEARRVLREGKSRDQANDVLLETVARLKVDL
ncbi:MAG: tetratricopeptide repeat protein [Pseudomonadota bacterium]|nr:tetratricopeptide repeat protein [Pseudomonadota bacterium]